MVVVPLRLPGLRCRRLARIKTLSTCILEEGFEIPCSTLDSRLAKNCTIYCNDVLSALSKEACVVCFERVLGVRHRAWKAYRRRMRGRVTDPSSSSRVRDSWSVEQSHLSESKIKTQEVEVI